MRILMTTDTIGGVWRFTQELASGLLEKDCDVALVTLGKLPSPAQQSWVEKMEKRWGCHFALTPTEFALEWMQNNEDAHEGAELLLLEVLSEFNADIVHANQFCFGALGTPLPAVITVHSDVLSWAASCRLTPLQQSPWLDRYRELVTNGLAGVTTVVAPTQWMLDAVSHNFRIPLQRHVIPNGRSIPQGPSRGRNLQAVTAGRVWDEAKNVAMLANVASDIPIFAAGDCLGPSGEVLELSQVQMLGLLSEEELLLLFRESAIYICTSKYEPFGLAPLEAALCGCALLLNDIPSLREIWQEAAMYFSDAASLTALLHQLTHDSGLLALKQEQSQQRARKFSREKMTEAYLSLFEQVIAAQSDKEMADVA